MKLTFQLLFVCLVVTVSYGQSKENFLDINKTWTKFYKAFETLDHNIMAEIHSEDLIRISGGRRILDYQTYINNYKANFERNKNAGRTNNITLRFFERLNNDSRASERGIYKLTVNKGKPDEQSYYGQFHVLLQKVNDKWLITMDYDSSEGGTIGEEQYLKASAIDHFDEFIKQ